jgi:DNA-binding XRE family transcriptional regulator
VSRILDIAERGADVSYEEKGRYSPSLEVAFQIARVLGRPLDAVFRYPEATDR